MGWPIGHEDNSPSKDSETSQHDKQKSGHANGYRIAWQISTKHFQFAFNLDHLAKSLQHPWNFFLLWPILDLPLRKYTETPAPVHPNSVGLLRLRWGVGQRRCHFRSHIFGDENDVWDDDYRGLVTCDVSGGRCTWVAPHARVKLFSEPANILYLVYGARQSFHA